MKIFWYLLAVALATVAAIAVGIFAATGVEAVNNALYPTCGLFAGRCDPHLVRMGEWAGYTGLFAVSFAMMAWAQAEKVKVHRRRFYSV